MDAWWSEPTHTGGEAIVVYVPVNGTRWQRFVCWLRNCLPLRCHQHGYGCRWWVPEGFIPEAGCPYHD